MLKRLGTISGLTLVSRLAGLLRDLVLAAVLGAGPLADAFMLAFRLPNHFRAIFAEGAFNAAFLPTYAATRTKNGDSAANAFASTILVWLVAANLLLLGGVMAAPALTLDLLAPGIDSSEATLTLQLIRITFPYLICMSLVALLSALLNAHDRFAAAAAAPILLNLSMIGGLGVAHVFPTAAHAAAWSVLCAGIAQVALLILAVRHARISLRARVPQISQPARLFLSRLGPAILTSGAVQVAVFADTILATFLPVGSLSHLYYADRIYQLPLGVIGIAVGTMLLPDIARRAGAGDDSGMRRSASRALRLCLDLAAPLTIVMIVLGDWIMAVLFVRGAFDLATAQASALILAAYSLGLVPALSVRALVACFQGRGDLQTPLRALAVATAVNIALKFYLTADFGAAGLALATSAGLWIYVGILFVLARKRGFVTLRPVEVLISAGPSVFAGAGLYALRDPLLNWSTALAGNWGMALALFVAGLGTMVTLLAVRLALGKAFG